MDASDCSSHPDGLSVHVVAVPSATRLVGRHVPGRYVRRRFRRRDRGGYAAPAGADERVVVDVGLGKARDLYLLADGGSRGSDELRRDDLRHSELANAGQKDGCPVPCGENPPTETPPSEVHEITRAQPVERGYVRDVERILGGALGDLDRRHARYLQVAPELFALVVEARLGLSFDGDSGADKRGDFVVGEGLCLDGSIYYLVVPQKSQVSVVGIDLIAERILDDALGTDEAEVVFAG